MAGFRGLADMRVIITGAASGIGRASAILFLQQGAKVFLVDLPDQNLVDQFDDYDHARTLEIDVTDPDAPQRIVDGAVEAFGGLDILVNNAGIAVGADFESTDDDTWDRVMDVNVNSIFRISRAAVPHIRQRGRGRIINVGSIMSDMAGPGLCAYGTSKHAVAGLTKALVSRMATQPEMVARNISFVRIERFLRMRMGRRCRENPGPVVFYRNRRMGF